MKYAIHPSALMTVLVAAENSYTDGRKDYRFEFLLDALHRVGLKVDDNAVYEESQRRQKLRRKRYQFNQRTRTEWKFEFECDDSFELLLSQEHDEYYRSFAGWNWTPSGSEGKPAYTAYCRNSAAKLLGYIKRFHANVRNLKLTIENKP